MKVPTYTSQTAIPTRGQGQFVTAQLSTSAMTAPALAAAEAGAMLKQSGKRYQRLVKPALILPLKKFKLLMRQRRRRRRMIMN
jgi:acetylornithine/succinyldiaminopimelate/putrescine aminotransferase